jgi:hypothetical protein
MSSQNGANPTAGYEATLHAVTHAPTPEGLEKRVHAALKRAPQQARVLEWPGGSIGWMRGAAAAAIVMVVAGGGWGVYRHAQQEAAKAVMAPAVQVAPAAGGFSSAGAMRTPETVKGPAIVAPPKAKKHKPAKTSQTPAAR